MTQIPIISGIYVDSRGDFRTKFPVNYIPVAKPQGISNGYLRPAEGLLPLATGPGVDRGGIVWNGVHYRAMGSKLVSVAGVTVTVLGDIGIPMSGMTDVRFDYSFDRLAIASNGNLFYWNGSVLTQVTDPDLGTVLDMVWVDGYFMTTDGANLVVTELGDPMMVDPTKYGSSEIDPDPVVGLLKLRNEIYAVNRNTIEVFDNVGGTGFPFQRKEGAQITRGAISAFHACVYDEGIAFVGGGRNEGISVWLAKNGSSVKLATADIDKILATYGTQTILNGKIEARIDEESQYLYVHLPDQSLVYDIATSAQLQVPVWFILSSQTFGGLATPYRARNFVRVLGSWQFGDPNPDSAGRLGQFSINAPTTTKHYGVSVAWEVSTPIIYNASRGAIIHELELVSLPGYALSVDTPLIYTSHSNDGVSFGTELAISVGTVGQTQKRLCWRRLGFMRNIRVQKFRGDSSSHLAIARLEAQIEPLNV